jgi:arylsulfatase A-like enzyme
MYEGGIRVPACAVLPGKIKPASRTERVALTMDLLPTICEVAGVKSEHEIDGGSILPILRLAPAPVAGVASEERTLFWVRREGGGFGGRAFYAARCGDWKLLQNSPFEPLELYNLKDDPTEERPLDKKHPMYRKLFDALRNHIIQAGAIAWQKYPVDLSKQLTH